jgi:hypothetical protein
VGFLGVLVTGGRLGWARVVRQGGLFPNRSFFFAGWRRVERIAERPPVRSVGFLGVVVTHGWLDWARVVRQGGPFP